MNNKVFISCAVTGSGDTASKHPDLPKTPEQIATAAIEASIAAVAICSGVFGKSGCLLAVSPDPVTAHDMNTLLFILSKIYTIIKRSRE